MSLSDEMFIKLTTQIELSLAIFYRKNRGYGVNIHKNIYTSKFKAKEQRFDFCC